MTKPKKIPHFAELAYFVGLILTPLGARLMAFASEQFSYYGVSMVVAPAYITHLKIDWLTYGTAEYLLQGILLVVMCLALRRFRLVYLLSFVTAFLYGLILDFWTFVFPACELTAVQGALIYLAGMGATCLGVAFFLHSYFPPEVYELVVKEICAKRHFKLSIVKVIFDGSMCLLAFLMSLLFFGRVRGISIGTIICAGTNGFIIGGFSKLLERFIDFSPALPKVEERIG